MASDPHAASGGPLVPAILLVGDEPDVEHALSEACRAAGVPLTAARRIADIEQWPSGQLVITDLDHITPWWTTVGAARVLVLVDDAADGEDGLGRGATHWLLRSGGAAVIAAQVLVIAGHANDVQAVTRVRR